MDGTARSDTHTNVVRAHQLCNQLPLPFSVQHRAVIPAHEAVRLIGAVVDGEDVDGSVQKLRKERFVN